MSEADIDKYEINDANWQRGFDAGKAEGAREERDKVLSFAYKQGGESAALADLIERGDHLPKGEAVY